MVKDGLLRCDLPCFKLRLSVPDPQFPIKKQGFKPRQYLKELPPRNSRSSEVGGSWRLGMGEMYFKNLSRR